MRTRPAVPPESPLAKGVEVEEPHVFELASSSAEPEAQAAWVKRLQSPSGRETVVKEAVERAAHEGPVEGVSPRRVECQHDLCTIEIQGPSADDLRQFATTLREPRFRMAEVAKQLEEGAPELESGAATWRMRFTLHNLR